MKRYRIKYQDSMAVDVEGNLVCRGSGVYWLCTAKGQPILEFDLEEVSTVEELPTENSPEEEPVFA
ncbi:MAG TPA: hypothetical protein VLE43_13690 [Candidatus Saccharimonadia bacterium]|nr:hypothetical protein [Candidatus Saccharimonadia bacterium]HSI64173.1 hypothetical protein [Candidatus Saccharimonadia bacterium]